MSAADHCHKKTSGLTAADGPVDIMSAHGRNTCHRRERVRSRRRNLSLPVSVFITLLILNFRGLLPYVFPSTGHIPLAISLALPLWVGHVIYG